MLQTRVRGKDTQSFIEQLCVADVKQGLQPNQSSLSVFTNSKGGIIDDLIITKMDESNLYIVSNAGCRHKDIPLMKEKVQMMQRSVVQFHYTYSIRVIVVFSSCLIIPFLNFTFLVKGKISVWNLWRIMA